MSIFYRDPRLFVLAILLFIAAGFSALSTIGRQEDPTITNLFATVITPFPGADPGRVEALVTQKIEDELREIAEIDNIDSVSRTGISVINIELSQFLSDQKIEQTWSEIRDALADAARLLPPGVPEPEFDNDRVGAYTSISAITMADGRTRLQPGVMGRYAEQLQDRLRAVRGTKLVELFGEREEEIRVVIDPVKLTELGLAATAVSNAIRQADTKVSSGNVSGRDGQLIVEVAGEIQSLQRIRDVPLVTGSDGRIVRVADVARVERTTRSPPTTLARARGKPAVLIAARMEDDLQVDTWMARVKGVLDEFEAGLPANLKHEQLFDQSIYTYRRLTDVVTNLAIGIGLVVTVLLFTLGWRSALIVAAILPLATLISVYGLNLSGVSIHQMSVTGLIVALGLLVDAGIVMVDDIRRRLGDGADRLTAVQAAIKRLSIPLLASTVTTALAFMPMVLLPGPAGDFVGSIALSVIIMLTVSLGLAVTITPALAGWFLKPAKQTGGPDMSGLFARTITLSLQNPVKSIAVALVLPVIGFGAFPTLKAQFFPGVDRDQFHIRIKLPEGAAISDTSRIVEKASRLIRAQDGISQVTWVLGKNAPAFYYNIIGNENDTPGFAEALVTTASPQRTEEVLPILQRVLDRDLPEARAIVRGLVQGPPVQAPVEIRVVGPDLATLRQIGERIRTLMLDVPDVLQARAQIVGGAPKALLDLDEAKVQLSGLSLGDVAGQLDARLNGTTGGSLIERSEELPVRVQIGEDGRGSLDRLANTNLTAPRTATSPSRTGTGTSIETGDRYPGIPVAALGEVKLVPSQTPIFRRNGERINTIQGFVHREVLPEEALKKVQARIAASGFELPEGYRFEVGGDADARDETLTNLLASLGIILALTVATIVLTFGSYRLSAVVAVVAILSMGLSLLALAIFQYPFGIQAVIGVIGSIGVSINAAIIIMSSLQDDDAARAGDRRRMAELVVLQSRHIISTTLTTFGGFLPLILAGGGFWPPFAMAIAGGVLLSTVVSFYFTPQVFALLAHNGRLASTRPAQATSDDTAALPAPA
ncbi:MAG: efflux RND transporter permease subunit [Pseudomonadota bacterium]